MRGDTGARRAGEHRLLHIRLLGGCTLEQNGRPLALPYDKVRALLAWLVLEAQRPVSRAQVADMLWPDVDPEDARANLRHALHSLKRALGSNAGIIQADRQSLCFLSRGIRVDVLEFLDGATARPPGWRLALYQGEFMQDVHLEGCPVWQEWCDSWRQRLHTDARQQLANLSHEQLSNGQWQAAEATVARWLALCSWDELAYRHRIQLALASGDHNGAHHWYQRCEQALRDELDIAPAPETRSLLASLPKAPSMASGNQPLVAVHLELPVSSDADLEQEAVQLAARRRLARQTLQQQGAGHCVELPDGGLLAYFGYPHSNEYAARRAALTAQQIGRLLNAEGARFTLGLHAGLAPVSERPDSAGMIAAGAGRLARQAGAGSIVVSHAVRDRLADALPLSPGAAPGSFTLAIAEGAPSTVYGREPELCQIDQLWRAALGGQHATGLLIRAEPGCGKTALVEAVCERVQGQGHRVLVLHCVEHGQHQAFRPLLGWVAEQAGLLGRDQREAVRSALARWLGIAPDEQSTLPDALTRFFVTSEDEGWAAMDDQSEKLVEALVRVLAGAPLCLIVEDLHWCDEATLETLAMFQARITTPLLLLATSRTAADTLALPVLTLARLPDAAMQAVVAQAAGRHALDDVLCQRIVRRAAGVPLYAQEMTRLWLSDGIAPEEGIKPAQPASGRILDMVAARLAHMGQARRVAQLIAVAGNPAEPDWLAALLDDDQLPLPACLAELRAAGILADNDTGGIRFRHALVFDAVYATLGQSERRALHARLAAWLMRHRPKLADSAPMALALHLSRADDPRAAELRLRAARLTAANAAWQDVLGQLPALAADLQRVTDPALHRRIARQMALLEGGASIALRGDGDHQGAAAYQRARALCSEDDCDDLFMAAWGCWQVADATRPTDEVLPHARALLQLASRSGNAVKRRQACFAMGITRMFAGRLRAAQHWLLRAVRETDASDIVYGPDSYAGCLALAGCMQCLRGQPQQGQASIQAAFQRAQSLDHAWSLAYVQDVAMLMHIWRGEPEAVAELVAELRQGAGRAGMRFWLAFGVGLGGVARTMRGEAEGLAELDETLAAVRIAHPVLCVIFQAFRAEALWHLGRLDDCLAEIEATLAVLGQYRSDFGRAELWRLRAACLAQLGQPQAARAAADQARVLAQRDGVGLTLRRLAAMPL